MQGEQRKAVETTPYIMVFFPKRYVSVPTPVMGMGTGRRLAVVCCWWGQRERGEYMWGRRWHLMGQYLPWQQH